MGLQLRTLTIEFQSTPPQVSIFRLDPVYRTRSDPFSFPSRSLEPSGSSPSIMVEHPQSVCASFAVWIAAGVLAWTGAGGIAKLGTSIPVNGGSQAYLSYTHDPPISYLFTWSTIVIKPSGNAVIALIFAMFSFVAGASVR